MKERALLLSGGAFRGAVQVPVIDKLIKEHEYDAVYGVSVGAVNGSMFCQDEMKELWEFWNMVDGKSGFLNLRWWWPFNGLYSLNPLRKKMMTALSLEKIKTPFHAGIVSATTGEYFDISTENMKEDFELWDAVQASSCMAGIMVPEKFTYDGETHLGFDGGYRNIIPVPTDEYRHFDVVTCTPLDRMKMKNDGFNKRNIISVALRGIDIFQDEIFDRDLSSLYYSSAESVTIYYPQVYPGNALACKREDILMRFELGEEAYKNPLQYKG